MLHSFNGADGYQSVAGLIADNAGNLYGTTAGAGANGEGNVFELSPPLAGQAGPWTETVLLRFIGGNGSRPVGGLAADGTGNLYGTTFEGGTHDDGVVFELVPPQGGKKAWTETVLYSFDGMDGDNPGAGLIVDAAGNLYGTTDYGGKHGKGVAFRLNP